MSHNVGKTGEAALQLKRAAEESKDEREVKHLRTDHWTTSMMQSSAMDDAATRAMFDRPQEHQPNNFQPMMSSLPMSLQHPVSSTVPSINNMQRENTQMQRQQEQQYAAAMTAQCNIQQQQQQQQQMDADSATMTGQQTSLGQLNPVTSSMDSVEQMQPQVHLHSDVDMHVAPALGHQAVDFHVSTSSGGSAQQQRMPAASAAPVSAQMSINSGVAATPAETNASCLMCGKKGSVFTCNGGCGLQVHRTCIGEDAIFPFIVGQLCGSCFIAQQNRASPEDLTKGGPNALSVRRAILCLNLETNSSANFDKFGHLASLRLGEIGLIAGYPIKPFADKFVEPYLQRWIREKLTSTDKWMLNVRDVFTVMIGLYSLKRACLAHGFHDKVIKLMKARNFTVMDYFGWHPAIEGPDTRCSSLCAVCGVRNAPNLDLCSRCHHKLVFPTTFTKYVSTLLAAFYAEGVGIPLGASTLDVFAHTNMVRGLYKGLLPFDADGVVWDLFTDQLRMIFGFLDITSNFGTLQLNPDLFVPEINIIFTAAYVNQAMITNEFEVVGKFLQCMKLFGFAKCMENKNMIESCERYLLFKHLPDGSWCKMNGSTVDRYKATVTCSKALLTPEFRGYGPTSHDFQQLLEKWARKSSPKGASAGRNQSESTAKPKVLVSGAIVKANTHLRLRRLEAMYKRQIVPKGRQASLESLMTERMKQLLKAKNLEMQSKAGTSADENNSSNEGTESPHAGSELHSNKEDHPIAADGNTDSEDVKSDHPSSGYDLSCTVVSAAKNQDEEDMLTSMSLHEDLEIFDGLQFEDGGGIIDMSFHPLGPHGAVGANKTEQAVEDADGTDAPGQDDDEDEAMDDNVYDDDEDENEDGTIDVDGTTDVDGTDHVLDEGASRHESCIAAVDNGGASTDFSSGM
uniref:Zinc finger PHD-type domain-containing protein n=1 Tax=Peronospora matthiolae TaxID=2874970 RepID=A0AAV1TMD4_9STRA